MDVAVPPCVSSPPLAIYHHQHSPCTWNLVASIDDLEHLLRHTETTVQPVGIGQFRYGSASTPCLPSTFWKNEMNFSLLFSAILAVAFLTGCSPRSGDPVHITLPDDYRGVFKITPDPEQGVPHAFRDDHFQFKIPEDGILKVQNIEPFERFHQRQVTYESGKSLPNGFLSLPPRTIAWYSLWSDTTGTIWFLIGTKEEYEAAQKMGRVKVGPDFLQN